MKMNSLPVIIGCVVILSSCYVLSKHTSMRAKVKMYILAIYTCALILWPFIWESLLKENAYDSYSLPSLAWPLFMIILEIYLMKYHTLEIESKSRKGIISMDANLICTLTFALGSILGAHKDKCCQNLFIYGVLGCIIFVFPNPNAPQETLESILIESIQKIVLIYSTGLLLGGTFMLQKDYAKN
tara:strand:+ start:519 stop:1073 length:555 start_codon:yes stop_codon:yes gene_type:complete